MLTFLIVQHAHARILQSSKSTTRPSLGTSRRSQAIEGHVLDVRRISRLVTIRTPQGAIERIVIPRETPVQAPHGANNLSGIRSGMVVHVDEALSQGRLVAKKIVAH